MCYGILKKKVLNLSTETPMYIFLIYLQLINLLSVFQYFFLIKLHMKNINHIFQYRICFRKIFYILFHHSIRPENNI